MGASLPKGGPAGLFLGFVAYGTIILAVNQCFGAFHPFYVHILHLAFRWLDILTSSNSTAEMVTYLPIASPFARLAGFWVDDALSFAMGWNYFFLMGELHLIALVPLRLSSSLTESNSFSSSPQPSISPMRLLRSTCFSHTGPTRFPLPLSWWCVY